MKAKKILSDLHDWTVIGILSVCALLVLAFLALGDRKTRKTGGGGLSRNVR